MDAYVKGRTAPTGPTDASINFRSDRAIKRKLIISQTDRSNYGLQTGPYYLCVFPYSDVSMSIFAVEGNNNFRQDISDDQVYTYNLQVGGYYTFRYTNAELKYNTTLRLEVKDLSSTQTGIPAPYLYYKVCQSSNINDCYMTADEAKGFNVIQPGFQTLPNKKVIYIKHNP